MIILKSSTEIKSQPKKRSRSARAADFVLHTRKILEQMKETSDEDEIEVLCKQIDYSEIVKLSEEMSTWRDNLEGTPLVSTLKSQAVIATARLLESIETSVPDLFTGEWPVDKVIYKLEEDCQTVESCYFPSAF